PACSPRRSVSNRSVSSRLRSPHCRSPSTCRGDRCASVTPPTRWPALPGVVPGPRLLARCMATLDTIATRLARCVELFRDPGAKQAQKAEFRALLGLLQDLQVTLTLAPGRLAPNRVPRPPPALTGRIQRPALPTLGTDGILRGEAMRDIRSVQLSGVPMVTHDPPPPPAARALPGEQAAHSDEPTFSPSHAPTPQTPSTAPAPPAASTAGRS